MLKRWGWLILLAIGLVAVAATVPLWLEPLLELSKVESNRIEGLASMMQIAIWILSGIVMLVAAIRRIKNPSKPLPEKESVKRSVGRAERSLVVTGDKNTFILDAEAFHNMLGQTAPREDLQQATQRYLQYLVDRYCYLDFKGMGISDRVPLRLHLEDLYVPLKSRIELPPGETWAREALLAGRKLRADESEHLERLSEPTAVLDLMQRHDGLIILGDPGAGKTTFLKYLTLQMATGTGASQRLPVLVPLSAYANALSESDLRLDDFICDYFHDLGVDVPLKSMLTQALKKGGAVVMVDGLDEVKEIASRETVVRRVIDFYTYHRAKGNKFLLTSRVIGYREVRSTAEGLTECTLVDFDDDEIEEFIERWTQAIEKAARGKTAIAVEEAEREREELLQAVRFNPGVRRLAANPLLLTILALMKRQGCAAAGAAGGIVPEVRRSLAFELEPGTRIGPAAGARPRRGGDHSYSGIPRAVDARNQPRGRTGEAGRFGAQAGSDLWRTR